MKYLDENGLLYYTQKIKTWLGGKVDKIDGKGLSANDYTTTEKTKLAGIASGAEVNVQPNWDETDTTSDAYIRNKPVIPDGAVIYHNLGQNTDGAIDQKVVTDNLNAKVPNTRKVNNKALSSDIELGGSDIVIGGGGDWKVLTVLEGFQNLGSAMGDKVDKVSGKGLSTNDYTTTEKNKLAGIASGAEVNVQSDWNQTTTTADDYIKNKPAIDTSMSGTSTNLVQNKVIKAYVDNAISGVTQFDIQVVTTLPTTGVKGVIYLKAHSHGTGDVYDEYIWTGSAYEKIGNTDIDLSGYVQTSRTINGKALTSNITIYATDITDIIAITNAEIDTICS